jgi:hypothetical protein
MSLDEAGHGELFERRLARRVDSSVSRRWVTVASWSEPELNPSYLEWARTCSVTILPARPYRPRDKAAAEVGVQVAERWILEPLRKRRFFC